MRDEAGKCTKGKESEKVDERWDGVRDEVG